jgi:outer membrane PBP1 activator LpoA protein
MIDASRSSSRTSYRSSAKRCPGSSLASHGFAFGARSALAACLILLLTACATAPAPAPDPAAEARVEASREALRRGEQALAANDLEQAEFYLDAAGADLPRELRGRLADARRELARRRADPAARQLETAREIVAGMDRYDATTGVTLLQSLEAVPSSRLAAVAEGDGLLAPWATLTVAVRRSLVERQDLLEAARDWSVRHPDHPIGEPEYLELLWRYGQLFTPPGRVAVLLPLEGNLAAAGRAIRDGLVAAWLENPGSTQLSFLPLDGEPFTALEAYEQATAQGYDWVIGPVDQQAVTLLTERGVSGAPALMLNWPEPSTAQPLNAGASTAGPSSSEPLPLASAGDSAAVGAAVNAGTRAGFHGLSLSQEEEAAAVARRMLADGRLRAILLLAEGRWGERAESAFLDAFLDGGGEVMALARFDAANADHSATLTELLRIEASRERKRRLQGSLGIPLAFEPSRRDDFEAIFMAAGPELGRQLKPQLRFFDAGAKPVYAMSRVYSGQPRPGLDRDLDGVVIPGTRWATEPDAFAGADRLASLRGGRFGSLFVLGQDAWNLLPWLPLMRKDSEFAFPGAIGDLHLAPDGRLLREPVWARFEEGRPTVLPPPPEEE